MKELDDKVVCDCKNRLCMVYHWINCLRNSAVHKYLSECIPAACMSEILVATTANHW